MSHDESLRQQTQEQLRNNPSMEKLTEQQVPNYEDRNRINNEIENQRRRDEDQRRQNGQ